MLLQHTAANNVCSVSCRIYVFALCTNYIVQCILPYMYVCIVHAQTTLVGWGGIISAGGPALLAFQRGIRVVADADGNRDDDACDDEMFSLVIDEQKHSVSRSWHINHTV